ncbi:MAG: hypothetical protein R8N23_08770 [Reichenbachiella sp.]|uniref:hypothetical protein n=1 Tax=Reichenbachiella sp. TaxID=2184521 RepID=UPI00296766BE|nr:hypothetical protein [Reichenbachiella sp.]MDW3209946.1 hypothetical protein [Reichenbachiella sp.]
MNKIRTLLIGVIIGGAIGAKIGTLLPMIIQIENSHWELIEGGLFVGGIIGLTMASVIAVNETEQS